MVHIDSPWQKKEGITLEQAAQMISEACVELRPVRLVPESGGQDTQIFTVNDLYIFRFPQSRPSAALTNQEIKILPRLASETHLPVPRLRFYGAPGKEYPYPFMGYQKIHGDVPRLIPLTENVRNRAAKGLGVFLRTLHDTSVSEAVQWGVPEDAAAQLNPATLAAQCGRYLERALSYGLIDKPEPLLALLSQVEALPATHARQLVHGALTSRNIVLHPEGGLAGVMDWGGIHIGHPAEDLALIFSFLPPEGRDIFYQTYGPVDEQTQLWAQFHAVYTHLVLLVHSATFPGDGPSPEAQAALALSLKTLGTPIL